MKKLPLPKDYVEFTLFLEMLHTMKGWKHFNGMEVIIESHEDESAFPAMKIIDAATKLEIEPKQNSK